jgi:glutamate-1-semialdehyde 2,1-aminomutase
MSTIPLDTHRSAELHERARLVLPGGVTGDGRYSEPYPIMFVRARGKWITDVDGNSYLDYHSGFGTAILGYAHPEVDEAVQRATRDVGAFVGVPHPYEVELAERLCGAIPGAERVALCGGGGSDAIYHAVRLARAATGRTKIVKIEGGYHGWHSDVGVSVRPILEDASYVGLPEGVPNSSGSLPAVTAEVIVATVNDQEALRHLFSERGDEIAGLIVEPALYSSGCVLVDKVYLELARELCSKHGTVLIFDEVMSGFRNGIGGAGARLGVLPDLGAFGKAVANGYVISFLAGRADLMRQLAPEGPVFYSGTFNGHPLSCAAAQATLDVLERDRVPERLWELGDRIAAGINGAIEELQIEAVCQSYGGVWNLYFNTRSVRNYRDLTRAADARSTYLNDRYREFLRERGIYFHKRHVNRCFITAMHNEDDIDRTVRLTAEFFETHHLKEPTA